MEFVENRGQWASETRYGARKNGNSVAFEQESMVFECRSPEDGLFARVAFRFVRSNSGAKIQGDHQLPGIHNYLYGSAPENWVTRVPTFASVVYSDLYEGIDLRAYESEYLIEYDILCDSGRRLPNFAVRCEEAEMLSIDDEGRLAVRLGGLELLQDKPIAWYVLPDGKRRPVESGFQLLGEKSFGLKVAETLDLPLVVDPKVFWRVLQWSTFIGGSGDDIAWDVAVAQYGQSMGQVFVVGETTSSNFPTTVGAFDQTYNGTSGDRDVFVMRLNAQASSRVFSTYIGSGCDEVGYAIDLADDGSGDHTVPVFTGYCTGNGSGTTCRYPTAGTAFDVNWLKGANQIDAFVSILSSAGSTLLYSTYLGGDDNDEGRAIAVIPNPATSGIEVAVGGWTRGGTTILYPSTTGAYQTTFQGPTPGGTDAFLARITTATGLPSTLLYSTYLGGSVGDERVLDLQVNPDTSLNNVEVVAVGATTSNNFPTLGIPPLTPPYQGVYGGGSHDGFVTRLNMAGGGPNDLNFSTFLGGSGEDRCWGVVLHGSTTSTQEITVGGETFSSDFPALGGGAWDTSYNGSGDGFVSRLNTTLTALTWSTFLGDTGADAVLDISYVPGTTMTKVNVCGSTTSSSFPVKPNNPPNNDAYQTSLGGGMDAFVTRISATGGLGCSTYLGAGSDDRAWGIAPDGHDQVIVVGETASSGLETTTGVVQTSYGGGSLDGFATKFRIGVPLGL